MRIRTTLVLPLLAALALAGCARSGDDGDGVATAGNGASSSASAAAEEQLTDDERAQKFAECMRAEGVDVPDPEPGGGGKITMKGPEGGGPPREKVDAAMQKCRKYLPNGGQPPKLTAEELEQGRKYSQCMRDNGIEKFPDPNADGMLQIGPELGVDPADPKFQAAEEACKALVPGRVTRGGGNGGDS